MIDQPVGVLKPEQEPEKAPTLQEPQELPELDGQLDLSGVFPDELQASRAANPSTQPVPDFLGAIGTGFAQQMTLGATKDPKKWAQAIKDSKNLGMPALDIYENPDLAKDLKLSRKAEEFATKYRKAADAIEQVGIDGNVLTQSQLDHIAKMQDRIDRPTSDERNPWENFTDMLAGAVGRQQQGSSAIDVMTAESVARNAEGGRLDASGASVLNERYAKERQRRAGMTPEQLQGLEPVPDDVVPTAEQLSQNAATSAVWRAKETEAIDELILNTNAVDLIPKEQFSESLQELQSSGMGGFEAALTAMADEPSSFLRFMGGMGVESLPTMLATAVNRGAGFMTGAQHEKGAALIELLSEQAGGQLTPANVRAMLSDPEMVAEINRKATVRGIIVGAIDTGAQAIAGVPLGVGSGTTGIMTNIGAQTAVQGVAGAGGYALGQVVTGDEIDTAEMTLEALGEAVFAAPEVAIESGRATFRKAMFGATRIRQQKQASQNQDGLVDVALNTELRTESPETYNAILAGQLKGSSQEMVWIPASSLQTLNQNNPTITELMDQVEGMPAAYADALARGGSVQIPNAAYLTYFADFHQELKKDIRQKPDGFSENDTAVWSEEEDARIEQMVENMKTNLSEGGLFFRDTVSELMTAGRSRTEAEAVAQLHTNVLGQLSSKMGVSYAEAARLFKLNIGREMPKTAVGRTVNDMTIMLDRLRAGDVPKVQDQFGMSLGEWVISKGGLDDAGGELDAIDADVGKVGKNRYAKAGGMSIDQAAREAVDAGYFPNTKPEDITPQMIIDAIGMEIAGKPKYSVAAGNDELQEVARGLNELSDYLGQSGIDLDQLTNEEVIAALTGGFTAGKDAGTEEKAAVRILNQFAGTTSLTKDGEMFAKAEQALAAGADAEAVRKLTGWFKGQDGMWRYEISDDGAVLKQDVVDSIGSKKRMERRINSLLAVDNGNGTVTVTLYPKKDPVKDPMGGDITVKDVPLDRIDSVFGMMLGERVKASMSDGSKKLTQGLHFTEGDSVPLTSVLDHPELFAAYPQLANIRVSVDYGQKNGGFMSTTGNQIGITIGSGQQRSTLLHEIQHAIQSYENFASGGNAARADIYRWEMHKQVQALSELERKAKQDAAEAADELADAILDRQTPEQRQALINTKIAARKIAQGGDPDVIAKEVVSGGWLDVDDDIYAMGISSIEMEQMKKLIDAQLNDSPRLTDLRQQLRAADALSPYEVYHRLAGEVEARLTEARADMTPEQRKATAPAYEYSNNAVIVVRGDTVTMKDPIASNLMFRDWFDGSKVVDADGQPLVMYTGTSKDKDFDAFNVPKNGVWFTADPVSASDYAMQNDSMGYVRDEDARDFRYKQTNTASRVIPVYLRITNPYVLTEADFAKINVSNYKKAQGQLFDQLRMKGYDGVDMGSGVWVVLKEPQQIKSTFNRGTWSSKDKKILNQSMPDQRNPESIDRQQDALEQSIIESGNYPEDIMQVDQLISSEKIRMLTMQDLVGMNIFPTIADMTAAAGLYTGIDSSRLDIAIPLLGGPFFPFRESNVGAGVVWANRGKGVTSQKAAKLKEGANYMMIVLGDADMHQSNGTVTAAFMGTLEAWYRDGRIDTEHMVALGKLVNDTGAKALPAAEEKLAAAKAAWDKSKMEGADEKEMEKRKGDIIRNQKAVSTAKSLIGFVGFVDAEAMKQYNDSLSFDTRKRIMNIMASKAAQKLGAPHMPSILAATREPSLAGNAWGDGVLIVEVDQENTQVDLGTEGTTPHPDFPVGIRGRVVGRMETPVNWKLLWKDWYAENADKASPRRAFELQKPIVTVTQELADELGAMSYPNIDNPRQAMLASAMAADNWGTSDEAVKQGGVSPQAFVDALAASEGASNLTPYSIEQVKAGIKSGEMKLYQLGGGEIYFMLKKTATGVELASVVNNEQGARGIAAPAILTKAIQEGATELGAYAVKSKRFPQGFLPSLYSAFGFEVVEQTPFSEEEFSKGKTPDQARLAKSDAINYWERSSAGYSVEEFGLPDYVSMNWSGSDELRARAVESYLRNGVSEFLEGRDAVLGQSGEEDFLRVTGQEAAPAGATDEGRAARDQRISNGMAIASRAQKTVAAIANLSGLELANLGLTQDDRAAVRKALGADSGRVRDTGGLRGGTRVLSQSARADQGDGGKPSATGRQPDGSLQGLPRNVGGFVASSWEPAQQVARDYMAEAGLEYSPPSQYVKADPERGARIAAAFEEMQHNPQDPATKAAYAALIKETTAQYAAVLKTGLQVEFIAEGQPDPYEGNPRAMTEDVRNNNHMWVFSTRDGFGSSDLNVSNNPLLGETGFQISGQPALANDLFRVVHDYFGHVKEGVGFRADGEENTWQAHAAMFSPEARKALTTETRGQNSWVNFGPNGETNRTAGPADTVYADQKVGLLPDWVVDEGRMNSDGPVIRSLNQELGEDVRGNIAFTERNAAGVREFQITLGRKSDPSTVLHEMAHYYLEIITDIPAMAEDLKIIREWVGNDGGVWTTEQHEQFARGFEAYLREGKAPSVELAGAFSKFKAWLMRVYTTVAKLDVELNDEVRAFFDRMVASEAEIDYARAASGNEPMFESAEKAGMTPEEWSAYIGSVAQAKDTAEAQVFKEVAREEARKRSKWWAETKAAMVVRITEEIELQPVYQAQALLRSGPLKLNSTELRDLYGKGAVKRLAMMYSKNALPMDIVARQLNLGYTSADHLVKDLLAAPNKRELINSMADQQMAAQHGAMNDTEAADRAMDAVHNERQADVLVRELMSIARSVGVKNSTAKIAREVAKRTIARTKVRDLVPAEFQRAEQRSAREAYKALVAGDKGLALQHKQQQLLNFWLWKESLIARERADDIVQHMKKYNKKAVRQKLGKAGPIYLQQIDSVMEQYEFKKVSNRQLDRRASHEAWYNAQVAQGNDPYVPEYMMENMERVNYRELTSTQLDELKQFTDNVAHFAKLKNTLLSNQKIRNKEDAISELVATAIDNMKQEALPPIDPNSVGMGRKVIDWLKSGNSSLLKMEQLIDWLDGGEPNGAWSTLIWQPLTKAQANRDRMTREVTEKILVAVDAWRAERNNQGAAVYIQEIDQSLTPNAMLAVALNVGNESNRSKLLRGHGWNEIQLNAILAQLKPEDWRLVKSLWETASSLWPQIVELEMQVNGIPPVKVEGIPLNTPIGTIMGDYWPLVYDFNSAEYTKLRADLGKLAPISDQGQIQATIPNGYTKKRSEGYAAPIMLDAGLIANHMNGVILDVTHRVAIKEARDLLSAPEVHNVLRSSLGDGGSKQMLGIIDGIANDLSGSTPSINWWSSLMQKMASNTAIAWMGMSVTTVLNQVSGYSQAVDYFMEKGQTRYLGKAMVQFVKDPIGNRKRVMELSEEMAFRAQNLDVNMRQASQMMLDLPRGDVGDVIRIGNKHLKAIQKYMFVPLQLVQSMVDTPVWMAAYEAEGGAMNHDEAVQAGDRAVRLSQMAGGAKDLAVVQQNAMMKLFLVVYSYSSLLWNRNVNLAKGAGSAKTAEEFGTLAIRFIMLNTFPALLAGLIKGQWPDDDEEESFLAYAAIQSLLSVSSGVPLVRDFTAGIASPFGYGGSTAVGQQFEDLIKVINSKTPETMSVATVSAMGSLFGLPSVQINRTLKTMMDEDIEAEVSLEFIQALLMGPPKK